MPTFHRLLVLSILALTLSIQVAPVGTVESCELGNVSGFEARGLKPKPKHSAGSGHATQHVGGGHNGCDVEEDVEDALEAHDPKHKLKGYGVERA